MNTTTIIDEDMEAISNAINNSYIEYSISDGLIEHDSLLCEVLCSAMYYIKNNPSCSIKEATEFGLAEWIK